MITDGAPSGLPIRAIRKQRAFGDNPHSCKFGASALVTVFITKSSDRTYHQNTASPTGVVMWFYLVCFNTRLRSPGQAVTTVVAELLGAESVQIFIGIFDQNGCVTILTVVRRSVVGGPNFSFLCQTA